MSQTVKSEVELLRQIADVAEELLDTKELEKTPFVGYSKGLTPAQELRQALRDLRLVQARGGSDAQD